MNLEYIEKRFRGEGFTLWRQIGRDESGAISHVYYIMYGVHPTLEGTRRRGEFVIKVEDDWEACMAGAEEIFQTLDPLLYPDIPVFQ